MTDSHRTDISFITICYNGFKDTCELIESLQEKLHSVTYEIIGRQRLARGRGCQDIQTIPLSHRHPQRGKQRILRWQ